MKSRVFLMAVALALPAAAFAQDKMMSAPAASAADTMMAAPEQDKAAGTMNPARKDLGATMMADPRMANPGGKLMFTTLKDAQALAAKGPTVFFFAADWCPTCRADMKQIDAQLSRLGTITIVVVDYDKEKDLKTRYGVTYQHTYVQIDAMGKKKALWSGGGVDGILSNVDRM